MSANFDSLVREEEVADHSNDNIGTPETNVQEVHLSKPRIRFTHKFRKRSAEDANLSNAVASLAQSLNSPTPSATISDVKRDEWDVFGDLLARKLRGMRKATQMETQHEINNVLFRAEVKDAGLVIQEVSNNEVADND